MTDGGFDLKDRRRVWTTIAAAVLATPIALLMRELKPEPTAALILVLAVICFATWRQRGGTVTLIRRLVIAVLVWLAVITTAYTVLEAILPTVDAEGHRSQFGYIGHAFLIGVAAALAALVAMYRPLRTNPNEESTMIAIISLGTIAGWVVQVAGNPW